MNGILTILMLTFFVVMHEAGHYFAARYSKVFYLIFFSLLLPLSKIAKAIVNNKIITGTPLMNSIYVLDKLLKKAFLLILPTPAMRPMNNAIKKETSVLKKVIPKPGRINFVASRYSLFPVDSSILKRIV